MPIYNVYLANLGGSEIDKAAIAATLQDYFNAILKKAKGYESAKIQWVADAPTMTAAELLVYYVKNSFDSIILSIPGTKRGQLGVDGTTYWNTTHTASEVYVGKYASESKLLANLAMHEMMHNKTHLGNGLHGKGHMADDTITAATPFSDANAALMASKLSEAHTQWTEGFARYNDPLRGI